MHRNKKRCRAEQVRRFRARFVQSVEAVLGDVVPAELSIQWIAEETGACRERIHGPFATLVLFIEQALGADHSCQDAVARGLSARTAQGQAPCSLNTAAYRKARWRLPLGLPERPARAIGARPCAAQPTAWRWRGREAKLIDGTTVSMPDTRANRARFPQSRGQKPGSGFPPARPVAIVSLSAGAVLEWAPDAREGKKTGETALLRRSMPHLQRGDVVIADGCYCGYFMIAGLIARGVDLVMPQHRLRIADLRRGQRLGARDHAVARVRPKRPDRMDEATYATMPETLTMREARVGGRTLIATLTDARDVATPALAELYAMRWHVELDLRAIKTVMQTDILRCKTPAMAEKGIAAHLLAYNPVRAAMARAACTNNLLPRQLSFKAALQLLNALEMALRHGSPQGLAIQRTEPLTGLGRRRLPHRPHRVEPRAVKRRPKQHRLLAKPRHAIRERLIKLQERRVAACLS